MTQKLLREALVELIDERGFDAITIGALTSRAMVSRAAFYRNYQDKYDLVEQIFEEAMSALLSAVGDRNVSSSLRQLGSEFKEERLARINHA
jgi:AcrR family transcriptional regulator